MKCNKKTPPKTGPGLIAEGWLGRQRLAWEAKAREGFREVHHRGEKHKHLKEGRHE